MSKTADADGSVAGAALAAASADRDFPASAACNASRCFLGFFYTLTGDF
jgi:hypothetical protein